MVWECKKCGTCCALFSEHVLGYKCNLLDKNGLCRVYKTRPKNCRIDLNFNLDVDKDRYLEARCALIRKLYEWKKEVGGSPEVDFIINKLTKCGLV